MAPDKIYTDNRGVYAELPIFSQIDANVEYIRKDALLEWLKANLQDRDNWNENSAADAFWEMIGKLNEM